MDKNKKGSKLILPLHKNQTPACRMVTRSLTGSISSRPKIGQREGNHRLLANYIIMIKKEDSARLLVQN